MEAFEKDTLGVKGEDHIPPTKRADIANERVRMNLKGCILLNHEVEGKGITKECLLRQCDWSSF